MNAFDVEVRRRQDALREGLAAAGFNVATPHHASGELTVPGRSVPIDLDITIPDEFPYRPPSVRPTLGDGGQSWHRERNGSLCLFAKTDSGEPRWSTAEELLEKVRQWYVNDDAGWPDDLPDLDLERYWDDFDSGVVYVGDVDWDLHQPLRGVVGDDAERSVHVLPGEPRQNRKRARRIGIRAIDVGELAAPLHNWGELSALIAGSDEIEALIRAHTLQYLLVRYWRQGHAGVLALSVTDRNPTVLTAVSAVHEGSSTMLMRAGTDADRLGQVSVVIIGLGAVGSYVADGLARAGVGKLTLIDGDTMRPGNLIRHLLGESKWVGQGKASAVAEYLRSVPWAPVEVVPFDANLAGAAEISELLESHDLVIDATATGYATALVMDASHALNRPAVSVCVLRDGGVVRVDRSPLTGAEQYLPPIPPSPSPPGQLWESGCGDPVSPSPPMGMR